MIKLQRKWTLDEEVVICDMKQAGENIGDIAKALGRSYGSVDGHLRQSATNARRRERIRKEVKLFKIHEPGAKIIVPAAVIADRDRRSNEPRTITMMLCGDPPFSQSALARPSARGQSKAEKAYETGLTYLDPALAV